MTVLGAWLMADFITGIVHWWEDRAIIGASRSNFINAVRDDNELHHRLPAYFLRYTWWENINTTAPMAWSLAAVSAIAGLGLFTTLTLAFLGFGNLIHRFAHEPKPRRPWLVRQMQRSGLFISYNHHAGHHFKKGQYISREASRDRYCVMTNWLNPVLDRVRFFRALERLARVK